MRTAFEREGDIRSVDLLAAFATLWRRRSSGVLRFSGPGDSLRFDVLDGDVVRVSASDPGFDAIEVLLRAGKLDATALEGRRLPSGKDRALAAREMGLLTERDWRWGERIRAVEILAHVVAWLEGSYAFDSSARPEAGELTVGIHRLILEVFLRSRDRAFVHHALPAVDAPLQRAADFEEKFGTLGLTQDALAVAAAIDGRSTAAEISRRTPPDPFSVEKLLAALATLGLLHPEYAAEPARATPGPEAEGVSETAPESEMPAPSLPNPAPTPVENDLADEPEIDLPLGTPVLPSEPEPALVAWESAPPEPMDQRLDLAAGEISPPARRPIPAAVWVLLVLAAAVGGLLLLRAREMGTALPAPFPTALPAPPTAVPALAPSAPAFPTTLPTTLPTADSTPVPTPIPTALPTVVPTPVPTAVPSPPALATAVVPAAVPPTRVRTPTAAPRRPTSAPARAASGRTRAEWLALAERDRLLLQQQPHALFSIQLELVCELPSLTEAWRFDRRGEMWLAPAEHGGRPCFRVFWGRYLDLDSARRAKSSVPRFFFTPTNHPAVVSTRAALLP
jgi:hypothetical protein